ncbi:MAG: serine hydrolase [Acidobacteria bacterium]|nr:serine hydrolase [Acidobacteriota bacterium]MDA1234133.1 serine hydrolase [Acidobacteriota bacterium]
MALLHKSRGLWLLAAFALLATACAPDSTYPHENEPIGSVREVYDGTLSPEIAVNTFRNIHRLFPSRVVPRSTHPRPLPVSAQPLENIAVTDRGITYSLDQFLETNRIAGLLVLHHGELKAERYRLGNTERTRWMSMSVAKSVTSTLIGAALKQGLIGDLADPVTRYVPALSGTAYDGVSVGDVLMMSSGVKWSETYTDPTSDRRRLLEAQIAQEPGGALDVMSSLPRAYEPGTHNNYNTGETQIVAEVLWSALGQPLSDYLHEHIWQPLGMEADATWWTESPGGVEIGGSGFSATLRDYGRFGQFFLEGGVVNGQSILPKNWTVEATTPKTLKGGEPLGYGYLWWPDTTDSGRRDLAYQAEGIHGQFIYINPAVDLVIVLWSGHPQPTAGRAVRESAFFDAVAEDLRGR